MGVYVLRCHPTGHTYVGASADLPARYCTHFAAFRRGYHINRLLQSLFKEHGESAFQFLVVETLAITRGGLRPGLRLGRLERKWIEWIREMVGDLLLNSCAHYFDSAIPLHLSLARLASGPKPLAWPPQERGGPPARPGAPEGNQFAKKKRGRKKPAK